MMLSRKMSASLRPRKVHRRNGFAAGKQKRNPAYKIMISIQLQAAPSSSPATGKDLTDLNREFNDEQNSRFDKNIMIARGTLRL